jgi:8-oxo-dGTP pyrophosphatase MutT (NUDIX family)
MDKHYNLIYLFNQAGDEVLMQMRIKQPFLGLLNGTGGKIEPGESILHSCYRELNEETGFVPKQHTEFQLASVRYDNGDHIFVHYVQLIKDVLPATMGEPLDNRWMSLDIINSLPKGKLALHVHRDLENCMKYVKTAQLVSVS